MTEPELTEEQITELYFGIPKQYRVQYRDVPYVFALTEDEVRRLEEMESEESP